MKNFPAFVECSKEEYQLLFKTNKHKLCFYATCTMPVHKVYSINYRLIVLKLKYSKKPFIIFEKDDENYRYYKRKNV